MKNSLFARTLAVAFATVLTSLLSACASKAPIITPAHPAQTPTAELPVVNAAPTESLAFKKQQVITLHESIEKNQLQVSYSLETAARSQGYFIKISMAFKSNKNQSMNIKPQITLRDSKGFKIAAYNKQSFLALEKHSAASEKIEWANSFWLKDKFQLPPQGIEVGELIYHCASLNFPMKLTVNSAGQDYIFIINETRQVVGNQPSSSHN
jgi:hypothetical protein